MNTTDAIEVDATHGKLNEASGIVHTTQKNTWDALNEKEDVRTTADYIDNMYRIVYHETDMLQSVDKDLTDLPAKRNR